MKILLQTLIQTLQPLPLENQHIEHAYRDGSISQVEDGTEKDEMSIGTEEEVGQPRGVFLRHVDDGEIEHVDHLSVQPAGIATAVGEEGRDLGVGALAKDTPVKHTVDDVAHSACRDEGDAKQHPELGVFLRQTNQNPKQRDDGYNSEDAQSQLQEAASAQPTEGHAIVLDKQ